MITKIKYIGLQNLESNPTVEVLFETDGASEIRHTFDFKTGSLEEFLPEGDYQKPIELIDALVRFFINKTSLDTGISVDESIMPSKAVIDRIGGLEEDNINLMLAVAEVYEMMLGGL